MRSARVSLTCGAAAVLLARHAAGFDAEVTASTYAQAYDVRGPAGSPVLTSDRITQTLSLSVVQRPATRRGITVSFHLRLRMDGDFGSSCFTGTNQCVSETDRTIPSQFQALYSQRSIDLPYAYLDVTNIGRGALDVRLGRILEVDPLGFFLFDGGRARAHVGGYVILEALAGLETRSGFLLSDGRFERDGLMRADRTGWDPTLAPYVLDHQYAPVVGVAAETASVQPVYARISYRSVWTADGISEEKVGGTVDVRLTRTARVHGDLVYSIPDSTLTYGMLLAEWRPVPSAAITATISRVHPTFDISSIWASFWMDATDEARLSGELPLSMHVSASASWFVRRYALSDSGPSEYSGVVSDEWNTGGSATLRARMPAWQATLRGQIEGGDVGTRAGLDADGSWWAFPGYVRLTARLSLWHVDDDLRPLQAGFTAGGVVGATIKLGSIAELRTDLEDDVNRIVGQRFRAMAILTVRGAL